MSPQAPLAATLTRSENTSAAMKAPKALHSDASSKILVRIPTARALTNRASNSIFALNKRENAGNIAAPARPQAGKSQVKGASTLKITLSSHNTKTEIIVTMRIFKGLGSLDSLSEFLAKILLLTSNSTGLTDPWKLYPFL